MGHRASCSKFKLGVFVRRSLSVDINSIFGFIESDQKAGSTDDSHLGANSIFSIYVTIPISLYEPPTVLRSTYDPGSSPLNSAKSYFLFFLFSLAVKCVVVAW